VCDATQAAQGFTAGNKKFHCKVAKTQRYAKKITAETLCALCLCGQLKTKAPQNARLINYNHSLDN